MSPLFLLVHILLALPGCFIWKSNSFAVCFEIFWRDCQNFTLGFFMYKYTSSIICCLLSLSSFEEVATCYTKPWNRLSLVLAGVPPAMLLLFFILQLKSRYGSDLLVMLKIDQKGRFQKFNIAKFCLRLRGLVRIPPHVLLHSLLLCCLHIQASQIWLLLGKLFFTLTVLSRWYPRTTCFLDSHQTFMPVPF